MGCGQLSGEMWVHLMTTSSTDAYEPMTPWYPAMGIDEVKAVLKIRALTGNFRCQVAIQVAESRTDVPAAWAVIDTLRTSAGAYCTGIEDISNATDSKFFVRFGVMYNSSSLLGQADVALQVSVPGCGEVVASVVKELKTPDTSNTQHEPLTGWISALDVDAVKAVFLVTGASSTFKHRLAYRTATTSTAQASAWSDLETGWSATGDLERCTGELSVTLDDYMWVQFGVAHVLDTSGSNGGATVGAAVATRRA